MRAKSTGRNDVDTNAEQPLQILNETDLVKKRCFRLEVNEEIHIAVGPRLAAGHRPEHPNVRRTP